MITQVTLWGSTGMPTISFEKKTRGKKELKEAMREGCLAYLESDIPEGGYKSYTVRSRGEVVAEFNSEFGWVMGENIVMCEKEVSLKAA